MEFYPVREFGEKLGVSVTTLRTWDKEGKLVTPRTPTNKRRHEERFYRVLGMKNRQEPQKIVLYARVSSAGQKPDLENQLKYLKDFAAGKGLTVVSWQYLSSLKYLAGGAYFCQWQLNSGGV